MASVRYWLESSLKRVYPATPAGARKSLRLLAARNDQLSFQVCLRNLDLEHEVKAELAVQAPKDVQVQVRRVGYVAQLHLNTVTPEDELDGLGHIPGYVPDPLYPETGTVLGPAETQSFWITVTVPPDAKPGPHQITLTLTLAEKEKRSLSAVVEVQRFTIKPAKRFIVAHWFYADSLCDWYKVEPYEPRFWTVAEPYVANYLAHGNTMMFVPHFTPPVNGDHRAHQLLKLSIPKRGQYRFDFTDVHRWIKLAQRHGARQFFFSHLFTQWGARHAARIYRSNDDPDSRLWPLDTPATAKVYRDFLAQYLPKLHQFLSKEGILNRTYLQMSDEPYGDEAIANYRLAQAMVRELAPWARTIDAVSDVRFSKEGLTDLPIAGLTHAPEFVRENIRHCVYFCCGPRGRYLNRLFDTPLIKIRMSGWLFYRLAAAGFLHWGYNYWYRGNTPELLDPFVEQAYGLWPFIPYGDPFVVYPGKDGPLNSTRWEIFGESLRDYALLETAGIAPDDPRLAPIRSYEHFPKTEAWLRSQRNRIVQGA